MNQKETQMLRNVALSLIRESNRHVNCIRISPANSIEHELKKAEICYGLLKEDKEFVTEAVLKSGGRIDIFVLDDLEAIEIMKSEKQDSIENKRKIYHQQITIKKVNI